MTDRSYGEAVRELEGKIGMPLADVPWIDHHDGCGLGWVGRCTCDPNGQCNLATTGECECGGPSDEQKAEWTAEHADNCAFRLGATRCSNGCGLV